MKRRLFNGLAAMSLLLCAATVALWVRSYWVKVEHRFGPSRLQMTTITFAEGALRWRGPNETTSPTEYQISCWQLAVLTLILPSLPFVLKARRAISESIDNRGRRNASRCKVCGYDLRATPERCPECGAIPAHPLVQSQV